MEHHLGSARIQRGKRMRRAWIGKACHRMRQRSRV